MVANLKGPLTLGAILRTVGASSPTAGPPSIGAIPNLAEPSLHVRRIITQITSIVRPSSGQLRSCQAVHRHVDSLGLFGLRSPGN